MATYTISATSDTTYVSSGSTNTWNSAREPVSNGSTTTPGLVLAYYQFTGSDIYQYYGFVARFNTSAIPAGETVTAVDLSVFGDASSPNNGSPAMEVYTWNVAGDSILPLPATVVSARTVLATRSTISASTYNSFTENGSNFRAAINKGGSTDLFIADSRVRTGVAPTGFNNTKFDTSSSGNAPRLVVTTSSASMLVMF